MKRVLLPVALFAFLPTAAHSSEWLGWTEAGQTQIIEVSYENNSERSDGGSGSSRGHTRLIERVVGTGIGGAEVEYDLPPESDERARAREWMLPARFHISPDGSVTLANEEILNDRLDVWLDLAGWTRDMCDQWIFTWNAFKIECDPQSSLSIIEDYGLRFLSLEEGATVTHRAASKSGILSREGEYLIADMPLDPQTIQQERVEADLVVARITGETLDFETALRERQKESVSGTILLRYRLNAEGSVIWREEVLMTSTTDSHGVTEKETNRTITRLLESETST